MLFLIKTTVYFFFFLCIGFCADFDTDSRAKQKSSESTRQSSDEFNIDDYTKIMVSGKTYEVTFSEALDSALREGNISAINIFKTCFEKEKQGVFFEEVVGVYFSFKKGKVYSEGYLGENAK